MKPKTIALTLATVLSIGVLAGCNTTISDPAPKGNGTSMTTDDIKEKGTAEQAAVARTVNAYIDAATAEENTETAVEIQSAIDILIREYGSIEAAPEEEKERIVNMVPGYQHLYFGSITITEQVEMLAESIANFSPEKPITLKYESLIFISEDSTTASIPGEAFVSEYTASSNSLMYLVKVDGKWLLDVEKMFTQPDLVPEPEIDLPLPVEPVMPEPAEPVNPQPEPDTGDGGTVSHSNPDVGGGTSGNTGAGSGNDSSQSKR